MLLTPENICVIGLVILMLSSPATQSKNPKVPVTIVPQKNVLRSQFSLCDRAKRIWGSPPRITNGRIKMADPTFVHHASSMVELLQKGSECFMSTA